VHILQIELARSLYMNERAMEKTANFAAVAERLGQFLTALAKASALLMPVGGAWDLAPAAE
jgi:N-formylglutamate amidohydrolase